MSDGTEDTHALIRRKHIASCSSFNLLEE